MKSRNPFALFSGKNILVVDDSDMNNSVTKAILESYGANVFIAQDGVDAVRQFEQVEPYFINAVLMDISMPIMNGCEAAKKIRGLEREDSKTVPIIAVTASVDMSDKEKILGCGMTDFLTKPIVPDVLCAAIGRYLE